MPATAINVDLCRRCRQHVDWVLANKPKEDIYIKAHPDTEGPPDRKTVVKLCPSCSNYVVKVLELDGFTLEGQEKNK